MKVKGVIFEDFINYKKPAMYIAFPTCNFKCDKECGFPVCQNSSLAQDSIIEVEKEELIEDYLLNPITEAIVLSGLEPFDSPLDLVPFIDTLRRQYECTDDIVIYTGYTEEELSSGKYGTGDVESQKTFYDYVCSYENIIIKFGRFRPNESEHFDEVLGVKLASPNQYAKVVSKKE